jgi:hypothetical protein
MEQKLSMDIPAKSDRHTLSKKNYTTLFFLSHIKVTTSIDETSNNTAGHFQLERSFFLLFTLVQKDLIDLICVTLAVYVL